MTSAAALLALFLGATPPPPWKALSEPERTATIAELQQHPLDQRLLLASERFLDIPYVYSPLGEGQGKDPDPLLRFDAVDCREPGSRLVPA